MLLFLFLVFGFFFFVLQVAITIKENLKSPFLSFSLFLFEMFLEVLLVVGKDKTFNKHKHSNSSSI
jgi:hypothetical protein